MKKLVKLMALIAIAGLSIGTIGCQQEETPESAVVATGQGDWERVAETAIPGMTPEQKNRLAKVYQELFTLEEYPEVLYWVSQEVDPQELERFYTSPEISGQLLASFDRDKPLKSSASPRLREVISITACAMIPEGTPEKDREIIEAWVAWAMCRYMDENPKEAELYKAQLKDDVGYRLATEIPKRMNYIINGE